MSYDDQTLMASLDAALRVDASPSDDEVAALRRLVFTGERDGAVILLPRRESPRPALRAAAIAAVILAGVGVIAGVSHTSEPSRANTAAAPAIGMPFVSPLAQARAAMSRLADALERSDDGAVERATRDVIDRARVLTVDDRAKLQPTLDELLRRAESRLTAPTVIPAIEQSAPPPAAEPTRSTIAMTSVSQSDAPAATTSPPTASVAPVVAKTSSDGAPETEAGDGHDPSGTEIEVGH
jgi:hypothetical protein